MPEKKQVDEEAKRRDDIIAKTRKLMQDVGKLFDKVDEPMVVLNTCLGCVEFLATEYNPLEIVGRLEFTKRAILDKEMEKAYSNLKSTKLSATERYIG
jgi:hypothetical protein